MDVRRVTFSSQENQGESGGENLQNVKKQKSLTLFLQKEEKGKRQQLVHYLTIQCTMGMSNRGYGGNIIITSAANNSNNLQQ